MSKIISVFICCSLFLSSCALFKRARVHENNGVEVKEFNLPIFLYPAKNPHAKKLMIFLSGDGGWIKFEDDLAIKFAASGFYTIGINSRDYFWDEKTPEQTSHDFAQLIRKYALKYQTNQIYFCGYSFGADVVPFIYNRLPFRARRHVMALELLSPYSTTAFKVKFGDLANISGDNNAYKVDLEIQKLDLPIYCFYGENEDERPIEKLKLKNLKFTTLSGDHHYDEAEYDKIITTLIRKQK